MIATGTALNIQAAQRTTHYTEPRADHQPLPQCAPHSSCRPCSAQSDDAGERQEATDSRTSAAKPRHMGTPALAPSPQFEPLPS